MRSNVTVTPAVTQVVQAEQRKLTLELSPEEAVFLAAITGRRTTRMNGEYDTLSIDIYKACRDFVHDSGILYSDHPFRTAEGERHAQMQCAGIN
jgi:hypothetical protein